MGHRLRQTAQRLTCLPDRRIDLSIFANQATIQGLIYRSGEDSQPWKVCGCLQYLCCAAFQRRLHG